MLCLFIAWSMCTWLTSLYVIIFENPVDYNDSGTYILIEVILVIG